MKHTLIFLLFKAALFGQNAELETLYKQRIIGETSFKIYSIENERVVVDIWGCHSPLASSAASEYWKNRQRKDLDYVLQGLGGGITLKIRLNENRD